ncbi:MAG: hypothetical protein KDC53_24760, partial [Saprospiraceae bacterium]|nr:hypothetical protein [Saprospiraceae bacterium]
KSALDNGYMHTSGLKHEDSLVFLMQHRFEAPVNNWFDQNVSIKYENDNLFQSLKNRRYSATFKLDLQTIQWSEVAKIQISLDYRNSGPMETSLIFALQDQNEQDIVWKSQELSSHEGSWKKQVWTQDRQPVWDEARYLGVYIWNAGQSDVEIDNVHLAMSRRSIEH